ncbi:hypothetical protein BDR03DRAFT_261422 [Suillus americanus]|nr:hypothetical protein BDR03DRAFT_261422 [Suillus americanus]
MPDYCQFYSAIIIYASCFNLELPCLLNFHYPPRAYFCRCQNLQMDESAMVDFFAVLGNELYYIESVPASSRVLKIFQYLKSNFPNAQRVLKRIAYQQCMFYKVKNPVLISGDDSMNRADVIQQCLDEHNCTEVLPERILKTLGSELRNDHVCLVIKLPQLEGTLSLCLSSLFACYTEARYSLPRKILTLKMPKRQSHSFVRCTTSRRSSTI